MRREMKKMVKEREWQREGVVERGSGREREWQREGVTERGSGREREWQREGVTAEMNKKW